MAKDGFIVGLAMVSVWAASYIAVRALPNTFFNQVQNFVGGTTNGTSNGGGGMS